MSQSVCLTVLFIKPEAPSLQMAALPALAEQRSMAWLVGTPDPDTAWQQIRRPVTQLPAQDGWQNTPVHSLRLPEERHQ